MYWHGTGTKRFSACLTSSPAMQCVQLDIDKLRAAGKAAATHGGSNDTSTMRSKNPDDIFNRVLSNRNASTSGVDQAPPVQPGNLDEVAVGSASRQMRNSVNGGVPPPSRVEEYEHGASQ